MTRSHLSTRPRVSLTVGLASLACAAGLTLYAQGAPLSGGAPSPSQATTDPAQGRGATGAPTPAGRGRGGPGNVGADFAPKDPIQVRSPQEQARSFMLPAGYRMELVAADPDVIMPVAIEFDGNGRMFVAEMRTYMLDADGTDKYKPISRISMWESTRGDGVYDRHTVFVDNLVLPRMILPLDGNSILTNETETHDVVKWTDTNGDGVADKRELFYTNIGRPGNNLEHQQSGFVWGLDNWIYSTYNAFRFRWTPNGILREPTGPNGGQWGLSQDDDGKMWWVDAGGERGPMNFQVPIQYGAFTVPDQFEAGFDVVWPAPGIGDMQGGMARIRTPVGNLNHFTAATGPAIVRAHRMPDDLRGDLLFTEPVGRLIRRAKIVKSEGLTQLRNAYPGSEFLLSSDPLFRPVNITNAPDGTLYIADMYHGIIQESQWTPRGSYLRAKIEQYQLDKIVGHGRIWRLRYDGYPGGGPNTEASTGLAPDAAQPRMLSETPAQLVAHLSHPNGWWRDTAQRLLVLKQDRSVAPALVSLVQTSGTLVARFHALWTLEGLGALDATLVRAQMKDASPRMRIQAIRASETLYKAGDRSFETDYRALLQDPDPDIAIQAMLTLNTLRVPAAMAAIRPVVEASTSRGVKEIGGQLLARASTAARGRGGAGVTPEQLQQLERGERIYNELCFTCHGEDGRGAPVAGGEAGAVRAPALEGSPRVLGHRDYVINVLLNGLTGPLDGRQYTEVMIPMGSNPDQWIADVASYVRNSFGNSATFIGSADVTRARTATASRRTMWTPSELLATVPVPVEPATGWKATASHMPEMAGRGLTAQGGGWTSGAPMQKGMWFQVELPDAVQLAEVQFDTPLPMAGRGGGGARGQGAGPAPAPPAPGFARGYQVQVSVDGTRWTSVATGVGTAPTTMVPVQPVRARFVRITQTVDVPDGPAWAIQRVRLYQVPPRS